MTMPIQFDTLEYAKTLQAAGIPQDQAEAHAQALTTALSGAVVVPSEMVLLKADLLARMDLLKQELEARMDAMKQSLEARMDAMGQALGARMDAMGQALEARMDAMGRALGARMDALEARLAALEARLTTLENSIRKLRGLVVVSLLSNCATLGAVVLLLARH